MSSRADDFTVSQSAELGERDGSNTSLSVQASGRSRGAVGSPVALDASHPSSEKTGTDDHTPIYSVEERRARHDDYMSFARHVRAQYILAKEPLAEANSLDLNALARVHFILGDDEEGFEALRLGRKYHRAPDAHDVAVALDAVARENPAVGLRMLKTLASHGRLEPVVLGTVVHHALQAGLVQDVEEAMELAREHNISLDLKSMDSVLRHTLQFSQHDRTALRDNLRRILAIIRSNQSAPELAVISVGDVCVKAALDARDSALAYDFWHEILRKSEDHQDSGRRRIRRNIGDLILRQRTLLGRETANNMVATLWDPHRRPGPFDVSGVGDQYGVRPAGLPVTDGPVPRAIPFEQEMKESVGFVAVRRRSHFTHLRCLCNSHAFLTHTHNIVRYQGVLSPSFPPR